MPSGYGGSGCSWWRPNMFGVRDKLRLSLFYHLCVGWGSDSGDYIILSRVLKIPHHFLAFSEFLAELDTYLFIYFYFYIFFPFIFISWRLITLQYCSGFCHTLTWISHGFTCVPHPDPPSHLPLHPIPLGLPIAPSLSTCLMHPTWAGDLFHPWQYTCFNVVLSVHPTLAFSDRV